MPIYSPVISREILLNRGATILTQGAASKMELTCFFALVIYTG